MVTSNIHFQGGVTSAHAVGRSATAVKVLTGENFTLTLDLRRFLSLTCDLSVSCRTFDLFLFSRGPSLPEMSSMTIEIWQFSLEM